MNILAVIALFFSINTNQPSIIGNWYSTDMENSTIRIYKTKSGQLYGKIIKSKNPDLIGSIILKKLLYDRKINVWTGEIRKPRSEISAKVNIQKVSDEKLKLVAKKYFITKTLYWHKK